MADILLVGGTIVDGTGDAPFVGDVAIADGKIAAVGAGLRAEHFAEGKTRLVDAAGKIVVPCWVDVHTHLDAQIQWDPWATPLSGNGVGTFVFGNCQPGPPSSLSLLPTTFVFVFIAIKPPSSLLHCQPPSSSPTLPTTW